MKKTREQKGITLIALIITIVVLLILAVVTISSITNDGIMKHAQNAANTYNEAQDDEKSMLDSYLDRLEPCRANGHTYGEYVILTEANCETQTAGSKERICSVCGAKETVTEPYAHQFVSDEGITGACYKCGYYCEHPNGMDKITNYYSNDDGTHGTWVICEDCRMGDIGSTYDCTFENSKCKLCGYECIEHTMESGACTICGFVCAEHAYNMGYCEFCGAQCPDSYHTEYDYVVYGYQGCEDGTHCVWVACETCGLNDMGPYEECSDSESDSDTLCDKCLDNTEGFVLVYNK